MCDADVDGSHHLFNINILFRFMRELIEEGHVYIAAPFYLVKKRKNMPGMTLNVMRD
jgi:DNA gyrase subunit B